MIYFDSDVLFNYLTIQDETKHDQARELIISAIENNSFRVSTLAIQEVGYGLARLGVSNEEIEEKLSVLSFELVGVEQRNIWRALRLAKIIGFKHINDCAHTAVAESLNCQVFYTYNKSDFKRIQRHTKLKISIL